MPAVELTPSARRWCAFGPLTIAFDGRVIEPRPWTEAHSRWAADLAGSAPPGPMLELCAGAGHIGLLAAVLADRELVQVEADPVAADYATENAARAGRASTTEVRASPVESAMRAGEAFPVVIADPPYLPTGEVDRYPEDPARQSTAGSTGSTCCASAWTSWSVTWPPTASPCSRCGVRPRLIRWQRWWRPAT